MRTAAGCKSATLRVIAAILAAAVMTIALGSPAVADPFLRGLSAKRAMAKSPILHPGGPSVGVADCPSCDPIDTLNVGNFSHPDRITGPWLPLVPGTALVLQGASNNGGGLLPHTVEFTVTDLRKRIGGIPCVVVWDRDISDSVLTESELSFWAQDDFGNVWNTAEYPEEYVNGVLIGAENTWVHGLENAEAGVHIVKRPKLGTPGYREGYAPENDFWDCGEVFAKSSPASDDDGDDDSDHGGHRGHGRGDGDDNGHRTTTPPLCVPTGCYKSWVSIHEWAPLEGCDIVQVKTYAKGVGIVQVGAIDDPEGETLTLVSDRVLGPDEAAAADSSALAQDARGYHVNDKYAETEPAYLVAPRRHHHGDDDDDAAGIAGTAAAPAGSLQMALRIGPNPVMAATTIDYSVVRAGMVELSIYDVAGRRLRSLVNGTLAPGAYHVQWNARDDAGQRLAAGVYFARLRTPEQSLNRTIVIAR